MNTRPAPSDLGTVLAVFAAGALGSLARYALSLGFGGALGTALVNLLGAFSLGLSASLFGGRARPRLHAAVGPGFLGGFTTMSGFALASVRLAESTGPVAAAIYWVVGLGAGVFAYAVGLWLGRSARSRDGAPRSGTPMHGGAA